MMSFNASWESEIIRTAWSRHIISTNEISAVLQGKDTRCAVEHILSLLDHKNHPWKGSYSKKEFPTSFINSPQTALDTLELLFNDHSDIFDRRDVWKAQKIALGIMFILSEYHWNSDLYSSDTARTPDEQKDLLRAQQKLTDVFHLITGNIIDHNFQTNPQFWDINFSQIIQKENVLQKIESNKDYPNIKRILQTFSLLNYWETKKINKKAA